jgi:hypothetical protein
MKMENKKYKDMTPEEKEEFLKKAKRVGSAATITGLATAGIGALGENSESLNEYYKKGVGRETKRIGSKLKGTGLGTAAAGLGIYGVAKYKHHKLKKDDNSKK